MGFIQAIAPCCCDARKDIKLFLKYHTHPTHFRYK